MLDRRADDEQLHCRRAASSARTLSTTHRRLGIGTGELSDVSLFGYMNQSDQPLASTRGHVMDHFGLRVTDLDAWMTKFRGEGVRFLEQPYKVGDYRAVMIEGPNREAIELIEIKP